MTPIPGSFSSANAAALSDGRHGLLSYFGAAAACSLTTAVATPLIGHVDLANIVMLFLLTVVGIGVALGRAAAILSAFLSVAMFDFFFVPPRFSFTVEDPQYLMTFTVMLIVALIIGHLTAGLSRQADKALANERRASALQEMARELTAAVAADDVMNVSQRFLRDAMHIETAFLLADSGGQLVLARNTSSPGSSVIAPLLARFAYEKDACTDLDSLYPVGYLPLKAPSGVLGVLAVVSPEQRAYPLFENHEFFQTAASLIGIALERAQLAEKITSEAAARR